MTVSPPWLETLPDQLTPSAVGGFVERFRPLSEGLLDHQQDIVGDPGALPALEWELEQRLLSLIRECFGPVRVLAEEYFARHRCEVPGTGRLRFVLDPLDGSASYARSSPCFATSLAIVLDGRPVVALVYEPVSGRLYSAVAGHGCYVNDEPLPHDVADASRTAVIKTQWVARVPEMADRVRRLVERGYRLERMESTSLKLCWVAEGRRAGLIKWLSQAGDVVLEWGTTAGVLICTEAGMAPRRLDGTWWAGHGGGLVIGDDGYVRDIGLGAADGS